MRIYTVTPTENLPADSKPRMIRAKTAEQAVRFATSEFYSVEVCTPDKAAELGAQGVVIENAVEAQK